MNIETIRRDLARRECLENNRQPEHREPRCTDGAPETTCRVCSGPLPEPGDVHSDCEAWEQGFEEMRGRVFKALFKMRGEHGTPAYLAAMRIVENVL